MMMMRAVGGHLRTNIGAKDENDDVVIVGAVRTAITRAKRGGLEGMGVEELWATVVRGVIDQSGLDPALVDEVVMGTVLTAGATPCRMGALYAGIPEKASAMSVNRQCASGLQAIASGVAAIRDGTANVVIAGGAESMSSHYGPQAMTVNASERMMAHEGAANCLLPMGVTSENVAYQFGITRREQDEFAKRSHERATEAKRTGRFREEIVPFKRPTDGVVITEDDGVRSNVTMEGLSKLSTIFTRSMGVEEGKPDQSAADHNHSSTTTAGNSSQVSDGAAALLLMKRGTAKQLRLRVLGKFVAFAVVGVDPKIMGIGPALAIPKVLQAAQLKVSDIEVFELNEAFASQAVYCIKKLGLDPSRVNPNGGAIALGHPLGCTGARQIVTLLNELDRRKGKGAGTGSGSGSGSGTSPYGIVSMCVGTGMGAAAIIERE